MRNLSKIVRGNSSKRLARVGLSTLGLLVFPGFAYGQSAGVQVEDKSNDPAVTQSVEPDAAPGLDIVVTAQKRSELARKVPIAIVAVSGDQLAAANIGRMTDLVAIVPNFTMSLAALQPITFVRGFGTTGSFSFEQAVGKFVDNVSYGRDFDGRYPLYDLERLEVLKGPQILLYGNSSTAGAINITTRKPGTRFQADGSVSYEFVNDEVFSQAGVTVPVGDAVSVRVAGFYQRLAKGWIHNFLTDENEPTYRNYGGRVILRIAPTSAVEILLKAEFNRTRQLGSVAQPIRQSVLPTAQYTAPFLDDERGSNYQSAPFFTRDQNAINFETYQADLNWQIGPGTLSSTTAYRRARSGNTETVPFDRPLLTVTSGQKYDQFSQELRYAGSVGDLEFLIGGYFEHRNQDLFSFTNFNLSAIGSPLPRLSRVNTYDQTVDSYSPFGQLTYHFTPDFKISAGARYSIVDKITDQSLFGASFIPNASFSTARSDVEAVRSAGFTPLIAVLGGTVHDFTGIANHEKHFQPQVIAQYDFAPRSMMFAKYVKGFKAGGVDATYTGSAISATPAGAQFQPEKAESFEAGLKGLILDGKLEYALTAYSTTFTNLQTSAFVGTVLFVTNVGKARSRGVELEAHVRPVEGLSIDAAANYQVAKYLDFPGAPCTVAQTPLPPAAAAPCTQSLSGAPTPFQSKYSGSFGMTYQLPVTGDYTLQGGWSVVYRSQYNTSTNNDQLGIQKGFLTLDAHIDVKPSDGLWTLSLFGRNLGDVKYKEYSVAAPAIRGGFNTYISRGMQVGVRLGTSL